MISRLGDNFSLRNIQFSSWDFMIRLEMEFLLGSEFGSESKSRLRALGEIKNQPTSRVMKKAGQDSIAHQKIIPAQRNHI